MLDAFATLLHPIPALTLLAGVLLGIVVGALPGMTGGTLMALTLPFTYYMDSRNAVILLVAMFVGGVSGGLITATLMRIPGEPSSVMTTLDGYPMARAGRPGRAIGLAVAASLVGGVLSWVALVLLSPPLVWFGLKFGPFENFALVLMALVFIASLSEGSFLKGILSGVFGMLVSMPGIDESSGTIRLNFGFHALDSGFHILPVILGLFAVSQVLVDAIQVEQRLEGVEATARGVFLSLRDYVAHGLNMLRSAVIGIWIGILPGVGASIASIVAYTTAKNVSRTPERFGTGCEEGIVASEAANNACTGGTLIPIITLGIPGGLADAILLSALIIHNLQPGPLLFVNSPHIVHAIMAAHLASHLVMFVLMTVGCVLFARIMYVPRGYVIPLILVSCIVGAFGVNNRMFDVWVMLAFGLVGYFMEYARVPLAPFAIGLILAPLAEGQLRSGLMASDGSLWPLVERPIALAFLLVALLMSVWPAYRDARRRRWGLAGTAVQAERD
jgi:putative tricarboxylic transport membrane protein